MGHQGNRSGIHRLAEHSGGIGHFAEVSVTITESVSSGEIAVLSTAFDWLKIDYGPAAWRWSVCDDYERGAVAGARYALEKAGPPAAGAQLQVTISMIRGHPAHTSPGDVALASCIAVCKATNPSTEGLPGAASDLWGELAHRDSRSSDR